MIKQYFTLAWHLIKENKLLSFISIIGTAMAILLIMVIIILVNAKTSDYEPETNRSRTLYLKWGSAVKKDDDSHRNYNRLSLYDIQQVFYPLTTAEAVSATFSFGNILLSVPGAEDEENASLLYTDAAFWIVNEFVYLAGKPYDQVSFESGLKQAVICESVARKMFGSVEAAIGRHLDINFVEFTVCGVVKDVNKFAELSYAEVWLPYTSNSNITKINLNGWGEGHSGNYMCFILAKSSSDFPQIIEEVNTNLEKMNANSREYKLDILGQPHTFFIQMLTKFANGGTPPKYNVMRYAIIIFIILLVPAINLSGITQSRMRKRLAELGVRKAFGATHTSIFMQVLTENMLLTILGGILGLLLAYISLWGMSNWLLASDLGGVATMNTTMISLPVFLIALFFCLLLNLLSAGIPAWRVARTDVVEAINGRL